jgi:hypothetical protein
LPLRCGLFCFDPADVWVPNPLYIIIIIITVIVTILVLANLIVIIITIIIVVIIKKLTFRGKSFWANDMIFRGNVRILFFLLGPPSWKTLDETFGGAKVAGATSGVHRQGTTIGLSTQMADGNIGTMVLLAKIFSEKGCCIFSWRNSEKHDNKNQPAENMFRNQQDGASACPLDIE